MVIKNRKPNRLKNFDYSSSGYYFVTICTKDKQEYFGKIINNKIILNKYGMVTKRCWLEMPVHFKNVKLDTFQIMPNHIHGIVIIKPNTVGVSFMKPETKILISKSHHHMDLLGLINQTPTLGLIIRYFKSKCSYEIHKNGFNNQLWQRNYYDHIIRNEIELLEIRKYIKNNPQNWNNDRNNL